MVFQGRQGAEGAGEFGISTPDRSRQVKQRNRLPPQHEKTAGYDKEYKQHMQENDTICEKLIEHLEQPLLKLISFTIGHDRDDDHLSSGPDDRLSICLSPCKRFESPPGSDHADAQQLQYPGNVQKDGNEDGNGVCGHTDRENADGV